jgi:hypothetical protein
MTARWWRITTQHWTAVIATLGLLATGASVYIAKRSYDLNAVKENREIGDKEPTVDVDIVPAGASSATVTISVLNRTESNIVPLDITVLPSLEAGEFYFSSSEQSIDRLRSSLSLRRMGTIAPKAAGTMKARLSGVTDGKNDNLTPGLELQFTIRVRLTDSRDTVRTFDIVRRIIR